MIWGALAANTAPAENYMIVVPHSWERDTCNAFFEDYAGQNGARGAAVRFGCMFADPAGAVWEGDPAYAERSCGW